MVPSSEIPRLTSPNLCCLMGNTPTTLAYCYADQKAPEAIPTGQLELSIRLTDEETTEDRLGHVFRIHPLLDSLIEPRSSKCDQATRKTVEDFLGRLVVSLLEASTQVVERTWLGHDGSPGLLQPSFSGSVHSIRACNGRKPLRLEGRARDGAIKCGTTSKSAQPYIRPAHLLNHPLTEFVVRCPEDG